VAASPPKRANRLRASGEYEELPLSHEIGVLKHRCGDIILVMARVLLGEPAGNGGADRAHGDVDRPSATAASASSSGRDVSTTSQPARSASCATAPAPVNVAARSGSRS